jgi:hypothetical protein
MTSLRKNLSRIVALAVAPLLIPLTFAGSASAAVPYSASVSATAVDATMTATTVMSATTPTYVASGGVCATGADGIKYAFPKKTDFTLTTTPTTFTTTATLPAGQVYSYFTCLKIGSEWKPASVTKNIFIAGAQPVNVDNTSPD